MIIFENTKNESLMRIKASICFGKKLKNKQLQVTLISIYFEKKKKNIDDI